MTRPGFVVDADHPGVGEAAWAASPGPTCPLLEVPIRARMILLAPHPDDEVLGCGGLLQRAAGLGMPIEVWSVTDGEACFGPLDASERTRLAAARSDEADEGLRRLGLPAGARRRLSQPDGGVDQATLEQQLREELSDRDLCVAPWWQEGHPDHDTVGAAAMAAVRVTGAMLVQYPVWAWHWADPLGDDLPWADCRRLELTGQEVAAKHRAIGAHRSQVRRPAGGDGAAVLPVAVLRRFWRRWELFMLAGQWSG